MDDNTDDDDDDSNDDNDDDSIPEQDGRKSTPMVNRRGVICDLLLSNTCILCVRI